MPVSLTACLCSMTTTALPASAAGWFDDVSQARSQEIAASICNLTCLPAGLCPPPCLVFCCRSWVVFEDRCPHRLAPLSEGRLEPSTGQLMCSYHGARPL